MSKVRTCCVCGKSYKYCPTCSHDPTWKMLYDSEKCKEISNVVSAYNMGILSKDKATTKLNDLQIDTTAKFAENIAKVLIELSDVPVEKPKRKRRKK